MEIKDFIKDALVQIVDGVREARIPLSERGSYIPTENITGENGYYDNRSSNGIIKRYVKVDFDIAVEVFKESSEKSKETVGADGEMRLNVAWISNAIINGKGECSEETSYHSEQQKLHHIKFSLPLCLPKEI